MVMEMARRLARRPDPLPRRVVFMAFSGEEKGLLGSRHYVEHPLYPARQDGDDGQLRHGRPAQRQGRADRLSAPARTPGLDALVDAARASRRGSRSRRSGDVRRVRRQRPRVVLPQEHPRPLRLHRRSTPTTTGRATTPSGSTSPGWRGSPTSASCSCSTSPAAPTAPSSSRSPSRHGPPRGRRRRPRPGRDLGLPRAIPDYGDEVKGVKLTGVREGSPAEKGGLKGGDVDRRLRRQADRDDLRLHREPRPLQAGRHGRGRRQARRQGRRPSRSPSGRRPRQ